MNTKNKVLIFLAIVIIGAGLGAAFYKYKSQQTKPNPIPKTDITFTKPEDKPSTENTNEAVTIPASLSIKVPFTPQAPTANWDELHNEACEEASAIMVQAYFNSISSLPPAYVEREIDKLTKWQQDNLGYYLSINTREVAEMIEKNYDLKTEIVDISEDAIKRALASNKLVIIPANGQMLDNPNFKQPGPIYHMFVITGYDSKTFIVNDPGTRKGENYLYTYSTIEAATGNWEPGPHAVNLNDKKIIIVSK